MKVNITQYIDLAHVQGTTAPMGGIDRLGGETRTSDGDFTALVADCKLIRVATDTQVYFKRNKAGVSAGATDTLIPAGAVEFFPVMGGWTPTITTA